MENDLNLDAKRKRARFRAWHRGMKEMDMLLGGYADAHSETMSAQEVADFEELMSYLDRDLFKWFTGEGVVPDDVDTPMFRAVCAFHKIDLS